MSDLDAAKSSGTTGTPSSRMPAVSSPSASPSQVTCWAAHVSGAVIALGLGGPVVFHLPEILRLDWKTVGLTFAFLCVLAIPGSFPAILALIGRFIPGGKQ